MKGLAQFVAELRRLLSLAQAPGWAAPSIIALGLAAALLEGAGLLLFMPLIDSLGSGTSWSGPWALLFARLLAPVPPAYVTAFLVGLLCLSIILKNAVNLFNLWVSRYVEGLVAHRLRERVFDQTLSSCIDYRTDHRHSDIVSTIAENSWKVSNGLGLVYRLAVSFGTFLVFIALMLAISVRLTLVAIAFLCIISLSLRMATRWAAATGQAVVAENKSFGLRMWESMYALQLIRAFARENYERARFGILSDRVRKRLLKLDLLWAAPGPISEISIIVLIGLLILVAQSANMSIAILAAFLSLLYRLQGPTRELMQSKVALDGLKGAIDDVDNFLADTRQPYLAEGNRAARPLQRAISFRHVSFRYPGTQRPALEDMSFEIPAGKTTAFVGASGAGKSTVLSLLFRFHDPDAGEITADDVSLASFEIGGWRSQLALMAQEVMLFNDTVAANIGYGDLDADRAQIEAAARIADAHGFISELPNGYDTQAGDLGQRLSGGQRQRIALARTILRDPAILLLDEATNALDVESEQAFQAALERYSNERTVVVIAHRLSTVQKADQIIVLSKGRVVEAGPPAQLLDRPSHFARLYELQGGLGRSVKAD